MISRTAGNDIDLADVLDFLITEPNLLQIDLIIFYYRIQSICNSLRLLMDLFHHEMFKPCLLSSLCIPLNDLRLFLDLLTIQIIESDLTLSHTGHLKITDIINSSCIFQDCRNIRCNVCLPILNTKDHRAVFSCNVNFPRIIFEHDRQSIRTTDTHHCMVDSIHRCSLILLIIIVHQFHRNLCICC